MCDSLQTDTPTCRICYGENEPQNALISPCLCKGSVKFIHEKCLRFWRLHGKETKQFNVCEQCKSEYTVTTDYNLKNWIIHTITSTLLLLAYTSSLCIFRLLYHIYSAVIEDLASIQGDITQKLYHSACVLIFFTLYSLYSNGPLLGIFNYIFTFWRIIQYNFTIDKVIFICFTIFYLKSLYREIKIQVQAHAFYLMNKILY
ncbi:MARH6 [Enterospora canceri]|uniref:MARH6 n=1 Tax=Enterospora canceri TaxID=1081671 RepID=A0A1Y1S5W7_9MICR|nr:MARH6 [Enterospora canceri]